MTATREPEVIPAAPARAKRRWGRIALIALGAVVLLAGGTAIYLYKYASRGIGRTHIDVPVFDTRDPGGAMNILLVGSDTRQGLTLKEQADPAFYRTSGQRSDTIILVHLFGDGKHAAVLSIPRDLRVHVPGYGLTKINAAYNLGPGNVVKTVSEYTGLQVNHYVEVNFVAFRRIVDALKGVEMCVTHPYHDAEANLFLDKAGCYNFNGDMALGYARTRKEDPRGDFDRIDHQQQIIRVMLQKATSLGVLFQPWKITSVIDAVSRSIKTDRGFDAHLAFGLAGRLKGAGRGGPNQNVDFRIVPSHPAYIGGISYVVADQPAQQLFDAIKADRWPLPDIPSSKTAASIPQNHDVTVRVYDGSGKGLAKAVWNKLRALGFDVKLLIKSAPPQAKTEIWFRPGDELKAQLVDEQVPKGEAKSGPKAEDDADVTVYVGADGGGLGPSPSPSG